MIGLDRLHTHCRYNVINNGTFLTGSRHTLYYVYINVAQQISWGGGVAATHTCTPLHGWYQRVGRVGNVVVLGRQSVGRGRGWLGSVGASTGRRGRLQQFGHEPDVRDGQPERFDPGQPLFVRERGHFAPELVKRLVQVVHAPALAYVGRTPLRQRGHPPPDFLRWRHWWRLLRTTAAAPGNSILIDTLLLSVVMRVWPHLRYCSRVLVNMVVV